MEEDDYHATWMHQRLKVLGFGGGLRAVQRFVRGVRDRLVRKAFLRFETEPGQQAQVDFPPVWRWSTKVERPSRSTTCS